MINGNSELINSPVRHISAKAEVYDSTSALISTYNDSDIELKFSDAIIV